MVIPEDDENYINAQKKIAELNTLFDANKMAATGFIVLEQAGYVREPSELTDIKVNVEMRKMTCRIDGIGFVISRENLNDVNYHPSKKSDTDDYYITEYKAPFVENGFLTADMNFILQDTSEAYFNLEELYTNGELVKDALLADFIDLYKETGNLPSFSGSDSKEIK
ncbi:hypothetical protein GPL15_13440 [Clostridium sp. MCC353]|uniref:hypothetical protein n=1 Tax=Clostridium sp. MCC353 TaxID=2592646 RepID=UPI001C023549|nr:hypothetical protein [Clostridium sp. MCC353]MBT9777509.1 hypothetical protein [Clostridium sp. MCC353]